MLRAIILFFALFLLAASVDAQNEGNATPTPVPSTPTSYLPGLPPFPSPLPPTDAPSPPAGITPPPAPSPPPRPPGLSTERQMGVVQGSASLCPEPPPPIPSPSPPPTGFPLEILPRYHIGPVFSRVLRSTIGISILNPGNETWDVSFSMGKNPPGISASLSSEKATVVPSFPHGKSSGGSPNPTNVDIVLGFGGGLEDLSEIQIGVFVKSGSREFTDTLHFFLYPCPEGSSSSGPPVRVSDFPSPPMPLPSRTGPKSSPPCPYPTPSPPLPSSSYLPPESSPPPSFYLDIFPKGGGSVPLSGQTTLTQSIGVLNKGSDTWEVSFSSATVTPGLSVSIDPKTVTISPNSPTGRLAGGGPGPAAVGAADAPPGATLPPSIAQAFPAIRSTLILRITEEPIPGKVYEAVVLARARSGSMEFTEELKFWIMPCPQQGSAPIINPSLSKELGWVTMGSSTGTREVTVEGQKINLTLFMTTQVKEKALLGRVPSVFLLMGIGAPAGASLINPEIILEALSGNLTSFPLSYPLPGPNASPYLSFREVERTTIPVTGGLAKARVYASEFEGTSLKGLLAAWRSGDTLAGVWAVVPDSDYPDVLKLIERVEIPQPKATPGFELIFALAALAGAGLVYRRR